jgi:hypothetical protein
MDDFVEGAVLTLDEEGAVESLNLPFRARTANKGYNFSFSGMLLWGRASREELTAEAVRDAVNRAMNGENDALDRAYFELVGGDDNRPWHIHTVDWWGVDGRWEVGGVGRAAGGWGTPPRLRCPRCRAFLPRAPNTGLTDEVVEYDVEGMDGVIHTARLRCLADPRWKCKRCGRETHEPTGLVPEMED